MHLPTGACMCMGARACMRACVCVLFGLRFGSNLGSSAGRPAVGTPPHEHRGGSAGRLSLPQAQPPARAGSLLGAILVMGGAGADAVAVK